MPSPPFDVVGPWRALSEESMAAIQEWRRPHPKASLQDMEVAIDERLAELRTRL